MGLPELGTYTSDDGIQKITIKSTNSSIGQLKFDYECSFSPVGPLKLSDLTGGFSWVANKEEGKGSHVEPFVINFGIQQRPSGFPYAVVDHWNGYYQKGDTLVLTGTRSYVSNTGVTESITLGTKLFSM